MTISIATPYHYKVLAETLIDKGILETKGFLKSRGWVVKGVKFDYRTLDTVIAILSDSAQSPEKLDVPW